MNSPLSRTSRKRASSCGFSGAYWEWTSTSGIVTASHFSGVRQPIDEIRRQHENACHDDVFRVAEVVVETFVARAKPVAGARDRERPDRRADERQQDVRREGHPEDAGRDRDERAHERRQPADEHADVPPAVEPALGAVEAFRAEMQPAPVTLEERAPAAKPDPPADDRAGEITQGAGERHHHERAGTEADLRAEERNVMRRAEDPGRDR